MTSREPAGTVPARAAPGSGALVTSDPWHTLAPLTEARIALGRAGCSLPTRPLLQFAADHAAARDAIHAPFDTERLTRVLAALGLSTFVAHSEAATRADYLRRPDLGRSLDQASRVALTPADPPPANRLTVVIADGLSPLAPMRHALPLLEHLRGGLVGWNLDTVVLAVEARVALADEIGYLRGAEAILMLIGERPGLKSADSLGVYMTYRPQPGFTDAERNCVSNIRAGGLAPEQAATRVLNLLQDARTFGASGIFLKEGGTLAQLPPGGAEELAGPEQSANRRTPRLCPDLQKDEK